MKYFTPARYLRLGNLNSRTEFLAAQDDWEDAITQYSRHLDAIKPKLQRDLRELIEQVYLHDAGVLSMTKQDNDFVITLQPETLPDRLIVLRYLLVQEPQIQTGVLPPDRCREPIEWLYDELDLERPSTDGDKPTFCHDVLLSNGWEVSLRFNLVAVSRPLRVIPVRPGQSASQKSA